MANRPHIMLGGGQPKTNGDPPIREQLDRYLKRLRRTVVFPITAEEMYFGLMPAVVKRLHEEGAFETALAKSDRVENFTKCLTTPGNDHFSGLKLKDESLSVYHVADNETDAMMWMYSPDGVPVPIYRAGSPFVLPLDHPHREAIQKWYASALKVEDGIQAVFGALAKLEIFAKSGAEVAAAWPELLNFVKYRRIMPSLPPAHARKIHAQSEREIPATVKRFCTEMLATCVMLPERNIPLMGWVHSYVVSL